ncbi:MAG: DUF4139 domain-containing protein, partial [Myxococcales bacterium]|nr:DUF4139 domain-containing protein [Myxococcales bacterium]
PGTKGKPRKLLLSYVTEAPSWKPSYRIKLGENGKVDLEGWAIVDNTSGEDWKNVKLGVGSSSALSFRFDLSSVRNVPRETLAPSDQFAIAPPTGMSVYGNVPGVIDFVDDATLTLAESGARSRALDGDGEIVLKKGGGVKLQEDLRFSVRGKAESKPRDEKNAPKAPPAPAQPSAGEVRIQGLARRVQQQNQRVIVEGFAGKDDVDKSGAALERANRLREQLIQNGVRADNIEAVANLEVTSAVGGARVVDAQAALGGNAGTQEQKKQEAAGGGSLEPIGTSHFESKSAMSVARGTSAMVSILNTSTDGEVVYLYDAESARGNKQFAFKSVRLKNPTDSTLETGPVTVFGAGRFIGEGLTEPIPGKSASFVPFALDRQIIVETKQEENEAIAKIITVQRGVLSTEMRKVNKQTLLVQNRLPEEASVYVRHTVPKGFKLTKHPENVERIGEAHLFRVKVPAGGKLEVVIEEETPVFKSVDMRSTAGMDLVRAFVSSAALSGDVAGKLKGLLELQKELGNTEQKIETQREQMAEYKARMDELHLQIVTLKAVKTGGSLMKNLEKKLEEVSDKLSKSTVDLVALEEQRMIGRIKLQDGVAELSLEKQDAKPSKVAEK